MAREIICEKCGEKDLLRGKRQGDIIDVTCDRCGHAWQRDLTRRCPTCGGDDLIATAEPILDKVRGNQMSIVGRKTVYRCRSCDE